MICTDCCFWSVTTAIKGITGVYRATGQWTPAASALCPVINPTTGQLDGRLAGIRWPIICPVILSLFSTTGALEVRGCSFVKHLQEDEGNSDVYHFMWLLLLHISRNTVRQQCHIVQQMWERQASSNHSGRFDVEIRHFSFFQVTTQLQYIEDSEPVVDGSRNRWCAVQWATKTN